MNERIKYLAMNSGLYFDGFGYPIWGCLDGEDEKKAFLEKFADLIISECINQLNKPEYAVNHPEDLSDYNRGWVNGRLLGVEHIEQHFRSEE